MTRMYPAAQHKTTPRGSDSRLKWAIMALLVLLTVTAFWGIWNYGFVNFDDPEYVSENRHVRAGMSWQGVRWAFTSFDASNWHPLTWLSHMLDAQLFGLWPGGHHLVNLGLHIASTGLLFGFLLRATGHLWPGAFVALLFAIHPLHVESVAWISERKDVLSTFFWMATLWTYLYYCRKPCFARYFLVALLFALGLMSKPMIVTLPFVLLLLDYWPLERLAAEPGSNRLRRLVLEKLPLMALAACSAAVTIYSQARAIRTLDSVELGPRLANAVNAYGQYLLDMVWPAGLAAFYPFLRQPSYLHAAVVLLLLILFTLAVLRYGRKYRYLPVGWFWYLITLIPVIGFVRVGSQSHADRYTYVPLIGIFLLIAWSVRLVVERRPQLRGPSIALATIAIVVLMIATHRTVGYWKDGYTLSLRAATVTSSPKMIIMLASNQIDRGEFDAALANFQQAEKLKPADIEVLNGLGMVMQKLGRSAQSDAYYKSAIGIAPNNRDAWLGRGLALYGLGQVKDAEDCLRRAAEIDPYWAHARSQFARLLGETGRPDEAIDMYLRAIDLDPLLPECHYNLGILYIKKSRWQDALAELQKKISLEPDAESWNAIGSCMVALRNLDKAENAYRQSIGLEPDVSQFHCNLAVVLAEKGRNADAVAELNRALLIEPANPDALAMLNRMKGRQQ